MVEEQLAAEEVTVFPRQQVDTVTRHSDSAVVALASGKELSAELVIVAKGARPETSLARSCGIEVGEGDAIKVNQRMETNVEDIYAAGDCAGTFHRLLGRSAFLFLSDQRLINRDVSLVRMQLAAGVNSMAPLAPGRKGI